MKEYNRPDGTYIEFSIKVRMRKRWVPHFLGMLKHMEHLGAIGSSRPVTFFSDGDGNFRPRFTWDEQLPDVAEPAKEEANGTRLYDAG